MKVKDLISHLLQYDENLDVVVDWDWGEMWKIESVTNENGISENNSNEQIVSINTNQII